MSASIRTTIRRVAALTALLAACWFARANAYSGSCGIWAMKAGDFYGRNYAGDQNGLTAAVNYVGSDGLIEVYPGCGSLTINPAILGANVVVVIQKDGARRYLSKNSSPIELSEVDMSEPGKASWVGPSITLSPLSKWYWREYASPYTARPFIQKDANDLVTFGCTGIGPIVFQPNNVQVMRLAQTGVRIGDNLAPQAPLDVNGAAIFRSAVSFGSPATLEDTTTPSVAGGVVFKCTPGSSRTLTNFSGGVAGQVIRVIFTNSNATIADGGNFRLAGTASFVSTADDVLTLVFDGSVWYEVSRSVN